MTLSVASAARTSTASQTIRKRAVGGWTDRHAATERAMRTMASTVTASRQAPPTRIGQAHQP